MQKTKIKKTNVRSTKELIIASVLTAVFTAMAVALSTTAGLRLPILGNDSLKISFGGIFTFLPAVMFGPIYGGIASALCDVLGCIIKPSGGYVPWFTVVAFIGGFVKGLVWKLLTSKNERKRAFTVRIAFICLFAIVFSVGCAFTASLNKDGIVSGITVSADELPYEDAMQKKELSFFSGIAASLAQYNHDTLTVKKVTPDSNGEFVIPRKLTSRDASLSIKNIDAAVLNTEGLSVIYVPTLCTGINVPEDFSLTNTAVTIVFEKPAEGKSLPEAFTKFAEKYSVANHVYDGEAFPKVNVAVDALDSFYDMDNITLKSSDTYRKNLAGYINFMTMGFLLTGILGIVFIAVGMVISSLIKKKGSERVKLYMKVLPAILISGVIVTTINTWLLLTLYYSGRVFWVLYIPRLAEELLMSVVQSYIITVLLGVISSHSLFRKYLGMNKKDTEEKAKAD